MATIKLNLFQPEQADSFDSQEFFQADAKARIVALLKEHEAKLTLLGDRAAAKKCRNACAPANELNQVRSHDAIFIGGARGTGKTSFILSLSEHVRQTQPQLPVWVVPPVDPSLLQDYDEFLNIIIARVHRSLEQQCCLTPDNSNAYFGALDELGRTLEATQSGDKRFGLDKLLNAQDGIGLADAVHEYFRAVCALTHCKFVLLPIDDVDMALHHGFKVLETVRRFLVTPHALPILSGDIALYEEIVRRTFEENLTRSAPANRDLAVLQRRHAQDGPGLAAELRDEYLTKLLPMPLRVDLSPIDELLRRHKFALLWRGENINGDANCDWKALRLSLRRLLSGAVNGAEDSILDIKPGTVRGLIQLLRAWAHALEEHREFAAHLASKADLDPSDYRAAFSDNPVAVKQVFGVLAVHFRLRRESDKLELAILNKQGMDGLSSSKENPPRLAFSAYYNPLSKPALAPDPAYDFIATHKKFSAAMPRGSKAEQKASAYYDGLTPAQNSALHAFPPFEPYIDHYAISQRSVAAFNGADSLMLEMFSFDNYYGSHSRKRYIFFGRFFEAIALSILYAGDTGRLRSALSDLFFRPPFHSIIASKPTRYIDQDEDADADEDSTSADAGETGWTEAMEAFYRRVDKWAAMHGKTLAGGHYQLVYKAMNKFFSQVNLFKTGSHFSGETLGSLAQRAALMLLNSFASFEYRSLTRTEKPVAFENAGQGEPERLTNYQSAMWYKRNVMAFLNDENPQVDENKSNSVTANSTSDKNNSRSDTVRSITAAIREHPLFRDATPPEPGPGPRNWAGIGFPIGPSSGSESGKTLEAFLGGQRPRKLGDERAKPTQRLKSWLFKLRNRIPMAPQGVGNGDAVLTASERTVLQRVRAELESALDSIAADWTDQSNFDNESNSVVGNLANVFRLCNPEYYAYLRKIVDL
ncbi:MAG: hypothetical protein KF778_13940 [Rhodocyclaceae bacterium]|nr:hypothetical protein [Rhodocyclaceae bacterium]